MRLCLFVAALLLCVGVVSGQTVTRQGYFNGTATLGGCLTANPADKQTYPIGVCVNATAPNDTVLSSAIVNDCSANGVITITRFSGSDSCNPANAQGLIDIAGVVNNTQYCNAEAGGVFATWSCSTVAPVNSPIIVGTTAYPFAPPLEAQGANNNCSASVPVKLQFNFTVGKCFPIPTQQYGVIANCVNGLVTAVFYDTNTCSVGWNYTTNSFANNIIPIGPYAQTGAASGAGKQPAQIGSTCGLVPGFSFMNFTCYGAATTPAPTTATPTTPVPSGNATTATPTTGAPTTTPSSTGTSGAARSTVAFGIAALVAPIIATASVFA